MHRGPSDPRDASAFIERTFYAIDKRPEPEAGDALERQIENLAPSYAETASLALAFQRWARRDCGHTVPGDLRSADAHGGHPKNTGSNADPIAASDLGSA